MEKDSQRDIWNKEYGEIRGVITSSRTDPSSSIADFFRYLCDRELLPGTHVIDLGCGAGRNSLDLAEQGFSVSAIDFSENAIAKLKQQAEQLGISSRISTSVGSIGARMPFLDNSFDLAVDVTATNSLSIDEFSNFESELSRILKPDGYFLSYVMADDDEYLGLNPDENGYTTIPESGLRDRAISEDLLCSTYSSWDILVFRQISFFTFQVKEICSTLVPSSFCTCKNFFVERLELRKKYKDDLLYGKTYRRALWWMVARKPQAT